MRRDDATIQLRLDGEDAPEATDLITGETVRFPFGLAPLRPRLLEL